jgi:CubicO group peptidase (beta-lactamase class C family)
VKDGWVVAERYAVGITPKTPLIGWSITKSLTHATIRIGLKNGELKLSERSCSRNGVLTKTSDK